jgi:hypothetical protein
MRRKVKLGLGYSLRDVECAPIRRLNLPRPCTARRDQRRSELDQKLQLLLVQSGHVSYRLEELETTPQVSDRLGII